MSDAYPVKNLGESDPTEASMVKPLMLGGLVAFIMGVVPVLNMSQCLCLPQIAGSLLAIHLYTKANGVTLSAGRGILFGIGASMIGGLAAYAVGAVLMILGINPVQDMMMEFFLQMAEKGGDPAAVEQIKQQMAHEPTGAELAMQLAMGFGINLVILSIGGLIGGAIGSAVFKRAPQEDEGVV